MKKPNDPQTQLQEVLYYLITRINITKRQMMLSCGVINLGQNILLLRKNYDLEIHLNKVKVMNKFNREVKFGEYSITDKKNALTIYKRLQEENN